MSPEDEQIESDMMHVEGLLALRIGERKQQYSNEQWEIIQPVLDQLAAFESKVMIIQDREAREIEAAEQITPLLDRFTEARTHHDPTVNGLVYRLEIGIAEELGIDLGETANQNGNGAGPKPGRRVFGRLLRPRRTRPV